MNDNFKRNSSADKETEHWVIMSTGDESEDIRQGEIIEDQAVVHQQQVEAAGDARSSRKELRVELQKLTSHNPPGTAELIQPTTTGTRPRVPTIASAKTKYEIAMYKLQEEMDHLEDPSRSGIEDSTLQQEFISIKQAEKECEAAATELINAFAKAGSTAEIEELNSELMSFRARIAAFRRGCRIKLQSEAGSIVSRSSFRSGSHASRASSSSSRTRLAKAELERKITEQRFLAQADDLEEQQAIEEAEQKAREADQKAREAEHTKRRKKLERQRKQLEREAEVAGLHAEIQVLEEDFHSATELQGIDEARIGPSLDVATQEADKISTPDANTTKG